MNSLKDKSYGGGKKFQSQKQSRLKLNYRNTSSIRRNTTKKQKSKFKPRFKLRTLRMKQTVEKIKHLSPEKNDSPNALIIQFKLVNKFLKQLIKKYDSLINSSTTNTTSNKGTKIENYDIFMSLLSTKLHDAIKNSTIIDDSLRREPVVPSEYIEDIVKFIDEKDILGEFKELTNAYFESSRNIVDLDAVMMNISNELVLNEVKEEYLEFSSFIQDINKAVAESVKNFYEDLKSKLKSKSKSNTNIDDLIMGLTAVKIHNVNGNTLVNKNSNSLAELLSKMGL